MRKTKTDSAYERLKTMISEERITRGRVIAIGEIAAMLDLGRAPVLTAVKFKPECKMSVNISEVTPQGKAAAWFADEVKARTDG